MPSLIAKNTFYLTLASVGQKFFSFIYFTLIARFVGVENTGLYVTALSFSSLFSILVDLGLTPVLIREGAKENKNASQLLGNILTVKILLALVAYGILNLVVYLMGYSSFLRHLIFISGIIMVLDAFSLSFYGVLRSFQNLRFEAVGVIVGQMTTVFFGIIVLWLKGPVILLLVSLGLGSLFNVIYSATVLVWRYRVWPRFIFTASLLKMIIRYALPFALAGIFVKVYSYIDVVLLSRLLGLKAVGWYSVPSKITFAFQFIPMAFSASLYPAMSTFFVHDKERLRSVFEKGMIYLAMLALPISFGLAALGKIFVIKVYGPAYLPSILPLYVLLTSLVFAFLDFPVGSLLNACHRQTVQTGAMGVTMFLNIILNLLLIPYWGVVGAAMAALIGNFTLVFIGYLWVPKIIHPPGAVFWWKLLKILVAAGLMGGLVYAIQSPLTSLLAPQGLIKTAIYLGILIIVGVGAYLLLLMAFRLMTKEEVGKMVELFKRTKTPEPEI